MTQTQSVSYFVIAPEPTNLKTKTEALHVCVTVHARSSGIWRETFFALCNRTRLRNRKRFGQTCGNPRIARGIVAPETILSQTSAARVFALLEVFVSEMTEAKSSVEIFKQLRPRLFGIAYRMTGISGDAEDIVQEAYLRWHKADLREIESPEAWLVTITTRLSIDRLRVLTKERETFVGPWLPEPIFYNSTSSPEDQIELADNLSIAFMVLLERLSPVERAAFLLRDVFDCSYAEVARIVGKNETACRQLIHRARTRVRDDKPRFEVTDADRRRLIEKFIAAVNTSDETTLLSLFAEEERLTADSGGKVSAARKVIYGSRKIVRLFYHLGIKSKGALDFRIAPAGGELGIITTAYGQPFSATFFEIDGKQIKSVYQVINPDKLKGLIEITKMN